MRKIRVCGRLTEDAGGRRLRELRVGATQPKPSFELARERTDRHECGAYGRVRVGPERVDRRYTVAGGAAGESLPASGPTAADRDVMHSPALRGRGPQGARQQEWYRGMPNIWPVVS